MTKTTRIHAEVSGCLINGLRASLLVELWHNTPRALGSSPLDYTLTQVKPVYPLESFDFSGQGPVSVLEPHLTRSHIELEMER